MLHYKRKATKGKSNVSKNTFNAPVVKKHRVPSRFANTLRIVILALLGVMAAGYGGYKAFLGIAEYVRNTRTEGAEVFSQCAHSFTHIKTIPTYGVVMYTDGESISRLALTAPDVGLGGIKALTLPSDTWMFVYFSPSFTFTQVEGFLRLSRLETGGESPCYVLEQLSLTSGVPIEYVIMKDSSGKIQATVTGNEVTQILDAVENATEYRFKKDLLPKYILGDGTEVSVVTYAAFQEQYPDFFKISEISQEQAFIEVYNVTTVSGYASIIARKWEMLGIEVSRVGNASHDMVEGKKAVIYIKDSQKYTRTLGMIKSSFPSDSVQIIEGRPSSVVSTGDIVVFLLNR